MVAFTPAMEHLRDAATGIVVDPAHTCRVLLSRNAARPERSAFEVVADLQRLSRVCLHLLARMDVLEQGRRGEHVPPDAAPTTRRAAGARADGRVASTERMRAIPDLIEAVLASDPERWWSTAELHAGLVAKGSKTGVNAVSRTLCKTWVRRGWDRRVHPQKGNQRQFRIRASEKTSAAQQQETAGVS